MSQLRPEGRPAGGQINVTVEPSVQVPDGMGVYVYVNDHYAVDDAVSRTAERLMMLLGGNFGGAVKRADEIIDHVMSLATREN